MDAASESLGRAAPLAQCAHALMRPCGHAAMSSPQEDNVAEQRLVLKGCTEAALLGALRSSMGSGGSGSRRRRSQLPVLPPQISRLHCSSGRQPSSSAPALRPTSCTLVQAPPQQVGLLPLLPLLSLLPCCLLPLFQHPHLDMHAPVRLKSSLTAGQPDLYNNSKPCKGPEKARKARQDSRASPPAAPS